MANEELSNTAKVYHGLHDAMMDNFFEEKHAESDRIAHSLLMNADLPAVIRAQCHMVLATGDETFLEHAKAAVEVLENLREQGLVMDEAFPHGLLKEARSILETARSDDQKMKEEMKEKMEEAEPKTGEITEEDRKAIEFAMLDETDDKADDTKGSKSKKKGGLMTPAASRHHTGETRRRSMRKTSVPDRFGYEE